MLVECSSHPWMRKLQKGGSTCAQEKRGLAIDAPGDGAGAEDTFYGVCHVLFRSRDMALEIA